MKITVRRIDGLRELGERLRKMATRDAKRMAGRFTGSAAKVIKDATKRNVRSNASRDGDSVDEGSLLASVVTKKLGRKDSSLTSEHIVTYRKRRGKKASGKQAVAPHAVFVEFGTVNMPPEPNLRNAFESDKDKAVDAGVARLEEELRKAGK